MLKQNWLSRAAVLLAAAGGVFAGAEQADAAQPYEYDFVPSTAAYNTDIEGVKQLVVKFDQDITVNTADRNATNTVTSEDLIKKGDLANDPIYVVQENGTKRINIVEFADVNEAADQLTITFKNLEYLDLSDPNFFNYELKIDPNVLRFDQKSMTLPFQIYDILPGFSSTFVESPSSEINDRIFKYNAPRDVYVHIPKAHIQTIETIHRYQGIIEQDGNRAGDPALTNIDILADEEAQYLNVALGNGLSEYERDLTRRKDDVAGFTMGQAGIDALVCAELEDCDGTQLLDAFTLKAYNQYGRLLETRSFRLRVADQKDDFLIDNYFSEPTDEFGSTFTLYELMSEKEMLENILMRMPVEDFNKIGVTYKVGGGSVVVEEEEQLQMALDNPNIHTISFGMGTEFSGNWTINRDLILNTNASRFTGALTIGAGSDIEVKINGGTLNAPDSTLNTEIAGLLTVNAGPNGTVILNNVDAQGGTTIISGGVNSVHLNQFTSAAGIDLTNSKPLRLVMDDELESPLNLKGKGEVTLAGSFKQVNVQESTIMYGTPNMKIEALNVMEEKKLMLIGPGLVVNTTGEVERQNNQGGSLTVEQLMPAVEIPVMLGSGNEASVVWSAGTNIQGHDVSKVSWTVRNPSAFGLETVVSYNKDGNGKILVTGTNSLEGAVTRNIVLQGSAGNLFFELTVPVTLKKDTN